MGTLFIIGNGFDINCGMKTRFCDVYDGYTKSKSHSELIRKFKQDIEKNIDTWGDFEMMMADYSSGLDTEEEFIDCVTDFQEYLSDYLSLQLQSFWNAVSKTDVKNAIVGEMRRSLREYYLGINQNVSNIIKERVDGKIPDVNIISFNYTDVFDILFDAQYSGPPVLRPAVCHIHGTLEDLTLGVDNESQLKNRFALSNRGKRCFIKPFFNEEYDISRVERAEELINWADTICVFGMSLGLSDLRWRNLLIEWLLASEEHHLFLYDYKNTNVLRNKAVSTRMTMEENAKIEKLKEWNVDDLSVFNRLHMPCGRNIFNIGDVIGLEEQLDNQKDSTKTTSEAHLRMEL